MGQRRTTHERVEGASSPYQEREWGWLVSTLILLLVLVRMRALQVPGPQAADLKAVLDMDAQLTTLLLAALAVLGLSVLLFRRWVFGR
jgi:hypothetical protein